MSPIAGNSRVLKETPSAGASSSCVTTLGGGFNFPDGVAVDGSGNVYVARFRQQRGEGDARRLRLVELRDATLGSGFSIPAAWRWTAAATSMSPISATAR